MPPSNNIHSYSDVAAVLAAALPSGRATYRLDSVGAASHWAMRANKYRLLLQRQEAIKSGIKGYQPPTPYDRMKLRRVGNAVEIDFNPQPKGELSLPGGTVIKPTADEERAPPKPPAFEPKTEKPGPLALEDLAAQLAAEFGDDAD